MLPVGISWESLPLPRFLDKPDCRATFILHAFPKYRKSSDAVVSKSNSDPFDYSNTTKSAELNQHNAQSIWFLSELALI